MQEVSAAIIIKDNKVLLARRGQGGNLPGYWEFPGGKREKNETIFECLEREIMEELGVRCRALRLFAESVYHYEHGTIKLIGIITELIDEDITLRVHDEYRWVEIPCLSDYTLPPADVDIVRLLGACGAGMVEMT
ncbi:MAG: (deoxy)nucleoside triphosphate pyrophosphohydrolase [Treponema sp.]|jgi:8-oxo-dGTP diphosphatase|nr:(deoxy)nucleoside triphosphate pyrophosphohydrolase [Treponema sp.]